MDKRVIFVHYARHVIGIGSFPVIVFQSGAYAVLGSGDVDLYREVGMDSAHSFYDIRGFPLRRVARGSMVCFGGGVGSPLCDQFSSSVCKPFLSVTVRLAIPIFLRW